MIKKGDLGDFERGMVVGVGWAALSISETAIHNHLQSLQRMVRKTENIQ